MSALTRLTAQGSDEDRQKEQDAGSRKSRARLARRRAARAAAEPLPCCNNRVAPLHGSDAARDDLK